MSALLALDRFVSSVGAAAWDLPVAVGRRINLTLDIGARSVRHLWRAQAHGRRQIMARITVDQIWFTGVEAVPLIAALATLVGVTTMAVGFRTLHTFGAEAAFGTLVEQIIVIELAPLLTAIVVAARTGSAVCTELLAMRLNDELDALSVHGVDPWVFVGLPRIIGITVATASLTLVFAASAYAACLVCTVPMGTALPPFAMMLADAIRPSDVVTVAAKGLLFGLAVATTTLHRGFTFGSDGSDLPRAATRGVMDAMVTIFLIDAVFALVA